MNTQNPENEKMKFGKIFFLKNSKTDSKKKIKMALAEVIQKIAENLFTEENLFSDICLTDQESFFKPFEDFFRRKHLAISCKKIKVEENEIFAFLAGISKTFEEAFFCEEFEDLDITEDMDQNEKMLEEFSKKDHFTKDEINTGHDFLTQKIWVVVSEDQEAFEKCFNDFKNFQETKNFELTRIVEQKLKHNIFRKIGQLIDFEEIVLDEDLDDDDESSSEDEGVCSGDECDVVQSLEDLSI